MEFIAAKRTQSSHLGCEINAAKHRLNAVIWSVKAFYRFCSTGCNVLHVFEDLAPCLLLVVRGLLYTGVFRQRELSCFHSVACSKALGLGL